MKTSTIIVRIAGRPNGTSTRHSVVQLDAPSIRAASTSERGVDEEERAHPERAERDREPDLRQDQRPVRVGQAEVAEVVVERHDHRLDRDHQPEQEDVEEHRRAAEAHQPERVAGQDREQRRDARRPLTATITLERRYCEKCPCVQASREVRRSGGRSRGRSRTTSPGRASAVEQRCRRRGRARSARTRSRIA